MVGPRVTFGVSHKATMVGFMVSVDVGHGVSVVADTVDTRDNGEHKSP